MTSKTFRYALTICPPLAQAAPSVVSSADGGFQLSGGVKGGMTVGIDDMDDHWLTETRFFGNMKAAPVLMLNAAVDYQARF